MITYENDSFSPEFAFDRDPESEIPAEWANLQASAYKRFLSELQGNAQEVTGSERFTKEEEWELAERIQEGQRLKSIANDEGVNYDGRYDTEIADGEQAKYALVVANLPFAAYYARASVGAVPHGKSKVETIGVPRDDNQYMGKLKKLGTFAPIANLAHPLADVEDRTQVALEAMWRGAEKYKPGKSKFITFIAWHIQQTLGRHSAIEVSGWDIPYGVVDDYRKALANQALYGVLPVINHIMPSGGLREGNHPDIVFEGRKGVALEQAGKWTAPEESHPAFSNERTQLELSDIVPDTSFSSEVAGVVVEKARDKNIKDILDTLSEREAGVIAMRFGLDDGRPKTLDEIARVYGVTRERIRQLESKTMDKLRQPRRSRLLRDFLRDDDELTSRSLIPLVDGAKNIKTHRVIAHPKVVAEPSDQTNSEPRESWQMHPDEEWGDWEPVHSS